MITIIHGDDIVSSRNYFLSEKDKNGQNLIDVKNAEAALVIQNVGSGNLFEEEKNVFIENLFKSKDLQNLTESIKKSKKNIFLYEDSELSKTQLQLFAEARIKLFKIPQELFAFLDNIRPGNSSNVINFHNVLKNSTEDAVFYMIIRQFRLLLALAESGFESIDDVKRLAPWQKSKLQNQAREFDKDALKNVYKKLFELDLAYKTGQTTSISRSIDFLLLGI